MSLYNFRQTDVSYFLGWLAEILQLCHFTSDASALMVALLAFSKLGVQTLPKGDQEQTDPLWNSKNDISLTAMEFYRRLGGW